MKKISSPPIPNKKRKEKNPLSLFPFMVQKYRKEGAEQEEKVDQVNKIESLLGGKFRRDVSKARDRHLKEASL
jgi:hypothetical protein